MSALDHIRRSREDAKCDPFGTVLSQNDWLPALRTLGTRHWSAGRMLVPHAGSMFDQDGNLTDEATRKRLRDFIAGFAEFIEI